MLVATVWGVDGDLEGLEHQTTLGPHDVPGPEALQSVEELMGVQDGPPRHPFWSNIEQRPTEWIADWENREASEPSTRAWVKFVPTATFADPWVDACRSLILIDLDSWPSATRAHLGDLEHFAPTIEVTARFIGSTADEPWLLSEASTRRNRWSGRWCRPGVDPRPPARRTRRQHTALPSRRPPTRRSLTPPLVPPDGLGGFLVAEWRA